MPTYDYHCAANGRTVEIKHSMSARVSTWGELCALAGIGLETTPADAPVAKQLAAANIGGVSRAAEASAAAPRMGGGCGGGACGHRH